MDVRAVGFISVCSVSSGSVGQKQIVCRRIQGSVLSGLRVL